MPDEKEIDFYWNIFDSDIYTRISHNAQTKKFWANYFHRSLRISLIQYFSTDGGYKFRIKISPNVNVFDVFINIYK